MRFAAILLWAYCATVAAQAMQDPTRPPPSLWRPQGALEEAVPSGPQLQSVMLSPSRRSAIISGQVVSRGERYGDAVLEEVAEDHVVLRKGERTEVLKLHPGAGIKETRRPASK
jgi:MSHA biogenesis protein MshK